MLSSDLRPTIQVMLYSNTYSNLVTLSCSSYLLLLTVTLSCGSYLVLLTLTHSCGSYLVLLIVILSCVSHLVAEGQNLTSIEVMYSTDGVFDEPCI